MNPAEMRALVERYIGAYNRMDIGEMLLTLHPDVEFKNVLGGVVNAIACGIAQFKALAEQSLPLFAERHIHHQATYDVEVNTAEMSVDECVAVIQDRLNTPGNAFAVLREKMAAANTSVSL